MKNTSFLAGALFVLAPVVVLSVPGCSGGNGGIVTPTATPTATTIPTTSSTTVPTTNPTTNPTATPIPTQGPAQTSNLILGNGQRAILTTRTTGTAIAGTLQILSSTATAGIKTRAIPFSFVAGTYVITGTVTPPRGYTMQGNFGTFGAFQMSGLLPTATQTGTYTLTVNGETESGIIPISGQPFPTATPVPTSPGGNYNLTSTLAFSSVSSDSDVLSTPITSFSDLTEGGKITNGTISGAKFQSVALNGTTGPLTGNGTKRVLSGFLVSYESVTNLKTFSVGQVINLNLQTSQFQLAQTTLQGTSFKFAAWRTTSGTATIKSLGTNFISVDVNAHFEPTGFAGGKGSFDLKGTLTGTGLTILNTSA
ncbi:hypothetical protein EON83_08195 [bacterium]|nr:MAG: hypothetical protein EON83_08195 [bacterium]